MDNITRYRKRLSASHPIVTQIDIDPAAWHDFERLVGDTPVTQIVGHDDPTDGMLTIYVACSSHDVADRLENGWA